MSLVLTRDSIAADIEMDCDVCIVGSGAGGSVLAAGLAQRGLRVVMLEEGGYFTRRDFKLHEAFAFPSLYQEAGTRATADLAITILQGRSVGGSTTVNWTTCFRTPDRILNHWADVHGVDISPEAMGPHFASVEKRLSIQPWFEQLVNRNNKVLLDGCKALGWEAEILRRNQRGCVNSGYCGFGCPVDGKQAMHITYIPDAVDRGMRLFADTRAERLETDPKTGRIVAVHARVMDKERAVATGPKVTIRPKVCVVAGGAINSPALLMKSGLDFNGRVGMRTFLHPVVVIAGQHEQKIDPFYGAPQSVSSHQFIDRGPGKVGYFMEAPPLHPMLTGSSFRPFGALAQDFLAKLPHTSATIALSVDGLLEGDEGGTVSVSKSGRISLDYPIGPALVDSFRHAHKSMARVQLAGGALRCASMHNDPIEMTTEADIARLDDAPYGPQLHTIFSAHQMGGCCMGADKRTSVVDSTLKHHHVDNLFIVDGSVLPTALGVNPSLTIYGLAHRAREAVAAAV